MSNKNPITVYVTGCSGTGKSTIATLIQKYLLTLGFEGVTVTLTDNEMPPHPTDLRKRQAALVDYGTKIHVVEKMTRREGP